MTLTDCSRPPDTDPPRAPRPAAPVPHARPLGWAKSLRALLDNPIAVFSEEAFERPFMPPGRVTGMRTVSDPLIIEHVLIGNAANYRKSPEQRRLLEPALGPGLITAEGAAWRSARAVLAPAFTPRAILARTPGIIACAEARARAWEQAGPQTLDITGPLQELAYDIVSRTLFGGALDDDRDSSRRAITRYLDTLGKLDLPTLLHLPPIFSLARRLRAAPARQALRRIAARAVMTRHAAGSEPDPDLLDRLLVAATAGRPTISPDIDSVVTGILTFLVAGHETTGNALAWVLYLLALHPECQERTRAEITAVTGAASVRAEQLDALPLTRAVVEESLRLYPPVPFIGREAIAADEIDDLIVKAGERVVVSPWVVHRHRKLWRDPELFQPERFLGEARRRIPRAAFLPFGLGPRICIGQGLAMQEILIVLAVLLPRFRFALDRPEDVVPEARITLRPRGGIALRITPIPGF